MYFKGMEVWQGRDGAGGRVGGRWQGEDICTWSAETRFVAPKVYTLN